MIFILVLCFFIIMLFIPIPIKTTINYTDNHIRFYLYKINVTDKMNFIKRKAEKDIEKKPDRIPRFKSIFRTTLRIIKDIKYKPSLKIKTAIILGLDDAAYTALLCGLVKSFYPIITQYISLLFNVKKNTLKTIPEFNKTILTLQINSIIFISLAKVIYITFIVLKNLRKNKKLNFCNI